jgi:hypothetical protein
MLVPFVTDPETVATARAETMLVLAEHVGVDLDVLAFVARRVEQRLGMLDAAEPARRAELERLAAGDFEELATTYLRLASAVERGGEA